MPAFSFSKRFFVLFVLIHIGVWLWQITQNHVFTLDSFEYLHSAENIKQVGIPYNGDFSEPIDLDLYTRRPPLYGLFMLLVSGFTLSIPLILLAQGIISLFALLLFYKVILVAYFTENEQKGFFIALLFTPSWFIYSGFIMSEILLLVLLVSLVIVFHRLPDNFGPQKAAIQGFQLLLTYLTKPVFYLFWPIQLVFIALYSNRKIKSILLYLGIVLMGITAYSYYNYHFTGNFQFSSMQRIGFVNFNAFHFQMQELGYDGAHAWLDSVETKVKAAYPDNYAAFSSEMMSASVKFCLSRPFSYALYYAKGVVVFFLDPGRFDLYNFLGLDKMGQSGLMDVIRTQGFWGIWEYVKTQPVGLFLLLWITLGVNGIKFIGYLIYLIRFKSFSKTEWFMLIILMYIAVLTGPNGASRYALPIQFMLIFGAVKGWSSVLKRFKVRS